VLFCSPKSLSTFYYQRTVTPTQEPSGPPVPYNFVPTTMKPTFRRPSNPGQPQPKPPSWGSTPDKPNPPSSSDTDDWSPPSWGGKPQPKPPNWGSTPGKPNPPSSSSDIDDYIIPYPPSPGMDDDKPPPATDDWRPIFPGKSSKTKSSKWKQGSWEAGAKGSKSGCIHINGGRYTDDGYPCVGYDDDRVGGKSSKGNYAGYSSIIDFQSVVVRNSGERIRSHRVGLSLVLLYCLSLLL